MEKVCVLMSTYNGEKYLKEQLDSILNQNSIIVDILIRDDGSTDKTLNILDEYNKKYNNIRYYTGENLKSAKSFLDLLFTAGEYDYYSFSDQDDVWDRDKLLVAVSKLKEGYNLYGCKKKIVNSNLEPLNKEDEIPSSLKLGNVILRCRISGCTMVFNRELRNYLLKCSPKIISMHDSWVLKVAVSTGKVFYDENKIEKSLKYLEILLDYNSHTNLTAIREEKAIIEKHFLDSLLLQNLLKDEDKTLIDIGTGAGFPGMMLAIFNEDKNFTLLDSVRKKTDFLELVKSELALNNVEVINGRAEEIIKDRREKYDVGLCRGVSNLSVILEYEIPFLKVNGRFLPQKMIGTDEIENSSNALKILNSKILKEYEFKLPFSNEDRLIIEILKIKKTDTKYPRKTGIPLKKPL